MADPVPGVAVSTPYGKRGPYWSCNANSDGGVHTGVDFACPAGTDVVAPIAGQIRHRNYGSAFGSHQFAISPDPDEPFGDGEVFFAHMTSRPSDGVRVKVGDYLGNVGSEGNVSGPHLHMEYHADTKGQWSCSTHDNPQPVLDHAGGAGGGDPQNPNDVEVGDLALVIASGSLNGRADPEPDAPVVTTLPYGAELIVDDIVDGWAAPPDVDAWFSTDYLWPKLPAPSNPAGVKVGAAVKVTADGGLNARVLPGGPQRIEGGEPLVRPAGYTFDVTAMDDGWASGGTNWYSSDYLAPVSATKPGWSGPTVILDDPTPDPNRYVSYAQAVVRVAGVTTDDGTKHEPCYVLAQDYENKGDIRFYLARANGTYADQWMQVNDGGHGQTFHAYRSAAGNLYVWCGEDPAYRYKWQSGAKVAKSSGTKMDYKGCRPVGSHEPWVGFRDATDTKETFYLFDRTDFTDGSNRTSPAKSVTIGKQSARSQQSWCLDANRIYRISGSTNDDPPYGKMLHVVEVFDWAGKRLLEMDVTAMAISTTSDEPEGLTYSGTPGSVLAGKREGSTDPAKRSYPMWTLVGMP